MTLEEERDRFIKEQKKYDNLVRLGRLIHQPVIVPLWNLKVTDKDGNIKVNRDSFSHSWTRVFFNAHSEYSMATFGTPDIADGAIEGELGVKDTSGFIHSGGFDVGLFPEPNIFGGGYGAWTNDDDYGNVIGTGTAAEDFEDFNIEGLIPDGGAGGEMEYKLTTLPGNAWNVPSRYWFSQWSRDFENVSGGAITVGNIAMIFFAVAGEKDCFIRDVLSPTQVVLNTETLTSTYEFRVFFP